MNLLFAPREHDLRKTSPGVALPLPGHFDPLQGGSALSPKETFVSHFRLASTLSAALLCSQVAWAATLPLPDPILPDPEKTPGAVITSDIGRICVPGYSKTVRHTSGKTKAAVYRAYGLVHSPGHYEIDHLIPLSLGGADLPSNLWPEAYSGGWGATVKDRLELKLLNEVCHHGADLATVQAEIASDWIAAFAKHCPTAAACPSYHQRVE